jgi:hypothetical protein
LPRGMSPGTLGSQKQQQHDLCQSLIARQVRVATCRSCVENPCICGCSVRSVLELCEAAVTGRMLQCTPIETTAAHL